MGTNLLAGDSHWVYHSHGPCSYCCTIIQDGGRYKKRHNLASIIDFACLGSLRDIQNGIEAKAYCYLSPEY